MTFREYVKKHKAANVMIVKFESSEHPMPLSTDSCGAYAIEFEFGPEDRVLDLDQMTFFDLDREVYVEAAHFSLNERVEIALSIRVACAEILTERYGNAPDVPPWLEQDLPKVSVNYKFGSEEES